MANVPEEVTTVQTIRDEKGFTQRIRESLRKKHPVVRFVLGSVFQFFPAVLMLAGFIVAQFNPCFKDSVGYRNVDPTVDRKSVV